MGEAFSAAIQLLIRDMDDKDRVVHRQHVCERMQIVRLLAAHHASPFIRSGNVSAWELALSPLEDRLRSDLLAYVLFYCTHAVCTGSENAANKISEVMLLDDAKTCVNKRFGDLFRCPIHGP